MKFKDHYYGVKTSMLLRCLLTDSTLTDCGNLDDEYYVDGICMNGSFSILNGETGETINEHTMLKFKELNSKPLWDPDRSVKIFVNRERQYGILGIDSLTIINKKSYFKMRESCEEEYPGRELVGVVEFNTVNGDNYLFVYHINFGSRCEDIENLYEHLDSFYLRTKLRDIMDNVVKIITT